MIAESSNEPELPFTPTNTGRRSRIGYLGITGENFNELWPLFVGVLASVALGMVLLFADFATGLRLATRLGLSFAPVLCGYGYLRGFVQGRPPHYRSDLWQDVRAVRLDFTDPPFRWLPFLPRLVVDVGWRADPAATREGPKPGLGSDGR